LDSLRWVEAGRPLKEWVSRATALLTGQSPQPIGRVTLRVTLPKRFGREVLPSLGYLVTLAKREERTGLTHQSTIVDWRHTQKGMTNEEALCTCRLVFDESTVHLELYN
jgi:hypothetical protein